MKLRDTSISWKIIFAFMAVAAIFVSVIGYQILGMSRLGALEEDGQKRAIEIQAIEGIAVGLEDLNTRTVEAMFSGRAGAEAEALKQILARRERDENLLRSLASTPGLKSLAETFATSYGAYLKAVEKDIADYLATPDKDRELGNDLFERLHDLHRSALAPLKEFTDSIVADNAEAVKKAREVRDQSTTLAIILAICGTLLALGLGVLTAFAVARPLKKAMRFAVGIAEGEIDNDLDVRQMDEVGQVCWALRRIAESLRGVLTDFSETADHIANGRLRLRGDASRYKGAYARLIENANEMADTMVGFLDAMPNPIMAIDKNHSILFVNAFGAKAAQTEPAKAEGRNCQDIIKSDDCGTAACACTRAMNSGRVEQSSTTARPGGLELEIDYHGVPITDREGNVVGALDVVVDQTEVKQAQKKMNDLAGQAKEIGDRLSSAAEELSAQVEQSNRGAEVQRSRASETATAMEQMNATVLEVASNASKAAENADSTREKAQAGAQAVEQMDEAMERIQEQTRELNENMGLLGEHAQGIGRIMNVINDIADQTNLLALNAAIEAARAGEAGRGFAVVADEVRKLAEKTMQATKEVGQAIGAIQDGAEKNIAESRANAEAVTHGAELARTSGQALHEIVALAERTSDEVRAIATASEEQSAASEQVSRSTEEINRISAETSDAMNQSAQAITELADLANDLNRLINEMHKK